MFYIVGHLLKNIELEFKLYYGYGVKNRHVANNFGPSLQNRKCRQNNL